MPSAPDRGGGAEPPTGAAADEPGSEARSQPRPEPAHLRHRFRVWRRTRPFWAGLWTLLAGLELALIPLSDIGQFLNAGQAAFTAALPGVVLVMAGAFMWFSPPNRTMAGLLAMVFAVASLVLSNLGGLLIGMMLGIVGGAMALGWTDAPRKRSRWARPGRKAERGAAPVVFVLVTALLTLPATERADARSGCVLADTVEELTSGLTNVGSRLLDLDGDACLVTAADLDSTMLSDIVAALEADAVGHLLESVTAAEVLANASGLEPELVAPVVVTALADLGVEPTGADGPTGAALLDAVASTLANGDTPLDLEAVLALIEDAVAGAVDADDLLARLLELIGDTVDEVLETVPGLEPDDDPETPAEPTDARVATAVAAGPGHDQGHVAPSVLSDLLLSTLDVNTLRFDGIVTVPTGGGPLDVMRFVIDEIDADGLDLILPDGRAADFGIANRPGGSLQGTGVVLDCTRLSLEITGAGGLAGLPVGAPIELTPTSPLLSVLGPILNGAPAGTVLSTENVDIDLVTLSVETLDLLDVQGGAS